MGTKREILDQAAPKMEKCVAHLEEVLSKIRAGKASPALVANIKVESYGSQMLMSQVSSITTPDAKSILIQPWDKSLLSAIEKAIINSNLGITPSNDGERVRLNIPPLTEERRKETVKQIKAEAETARVSIRGFRRDAIDAIKKAVKDAGLPEDVAKDGEDEAQKLTDKLNKKIDEIVAKKEKEIMTI